MRDPRLISFETELRERHPNLSDASVDFFVRQRESRLALKDLEDTTKNAKKDT